MINSNSIIPSSKSSNNLLVLPDMTSEISNSIGWLLSEIVTRGDALDAASALRVVILRGAFYFEDKYAEDDFNALSVIA